MTPLALHATPLLPFLLALALAGSALADGGEPSVGETSNVAMQTVGSSLPVRLDPSPNVPPPPQRPLTAARPEDEQMFMLMLLSRTTFAFGHFGQ